MRRSLLRLPILLVLIFSPVVLASCGEHAGPKAWDPSAPDVCKVVTQEDAARALGEDPGRGVSGVPYENFPFHKCHYGPLNDNKSVDVWIQLESGELSTFTEWVKSNLSSSDYPGMKSLSGVGDAAYMIPNTTPAAQWSVVFLKDTNMVYVYVPLNGRASALVEQLTIELAQTAAGRM